MTIFELLGRLWGYITPKRQFQFGVLSIVMIVASLAEMISIGAVFPFLAVLVDPVSIYSYPAVQPIIGYLGLTKPEEMLMPLTLMFALAVLTAGVVRILLLWMSTRLSFAAGSELSIDMYRKTLYQPYSVHVGRNSSEVINAISTKANAIIYNVITPFLMLASALIMLTIILLIIISLNPIVTLGTFFGFAAVYGVIVYVTKEILLAHSATVATESTKVIKSLQEGLGGIRDVLIDGTQELYCKDYQEADRAMRTAQGSVHYISHSPRYAMETIGMLLIAVIVYFMTGNSETGAINAIPTLGVLAMATQKLLPLFQQAYLGWTTIRGSQSSLIDTLTMLDQKIPVISNIKNENFDLKRNISLNNVSFSYSPREDSVNWILRNLSLTIEKGSCVGFIGETGTGKSTVLDIFMGLIHPTKGALFIDGQEIATSNVREWQKQIAHVPQMIFLADNSIAENIAFGLPKDSIDMKRVRCAAGQAQISETIENWPHQYETKVGERGVRLSGGQRQRIGIARALYKGAKVIIFDEATSALDNETEQLVMDAIAALRGDVTVLIVAHRISTLKYCSEIFDLEKGAVKWSGGYQEMLLRANAGNKP